MVEPHAVKMLFAGVKKMMKTLRKEAGPFPAGKHPTWTRMRGQPGRAAVL